MISALRHVFVDSWLGRILAFLIFLAFIGWGVGDIFTNLGGTNADTVARIGKRRITADDLSRGIRSELPQMAQQMGVGDPSQIPQAERAQVAREVLQRLVTQQEVLLAADRNGMHVPDALVRDEVFGMPYFHGANGQFDRKVFDQRMAQAGLTERRVLDMVRDDITVRGLLDGMGDTVRVPSTILHRLLDFDAAQHVLDVVRVNAGAMAAPPAPTDAQLHRYYDNHPWEFRTAAYRHAKVVVLSTETVARSIDIPDADLKRLYDFQSQRYHVPETRSLEVLTFQDQAKAQQAVQDWKSGASWDAVQKDNHDAAAVSLPDTRQSDVPNPELAKASFGAAQGEIQGPLKTETGWVVFRVIDIKAPHNVDFAQAKDALREEVAKAQAPQVLSARMARFQDAVAGSADLEHVPADIGAVPAQGSLDAQGMTKEGEPAPLPGDAALRQAIVARIFSQPQNAKPSIVQGPKGSAFAVLVDQVEPGAVKPFDSVHDQVASAWTDAARRHAADVQAAGLFNKAKQSGGVARAVANTPDAAMLQSGVSFSRVRPAAIPQELAQLALGTPVGQSAMLNVDDDYYVVTVTGVRAPDAATTKELTDRLEPQLRQSMQNDIPMTFVRGLEQRVKPVPNMGLLQRVIDSTGAGAAP